MWHITNRANYTILRMFAANVIEPIFDMLVEGAGTNQPNLRTTIRYVSLDTERRTLIDRILNTKHESVVFGALCNDICSSQSRSTLTFLRNVYYQQNEEVLRGNYNLTPVAVLPQLKTIFNKFYYDRFFADNEVWNAIMGSSFSRDDFHNNIKAENGNLPACPYCDLDSINSSGSAIIEHFLPKSIFPFLAMNPQNMLSACYACNGSWGKATNVALPITAPLVEQIGDLVEFKFDAATSSIALSSTRKDVSNYLGLTKLESRYNTPRTFRFIRDRASSSFASYQRMHGEWTLVDLLKYARMSGAGGPLNFAVRAQLRGFYEADVIRFWEETSIND